ncbi:MAG TPA: LysR family transcriptional regulator [Orrella sp.]
MNKIRTPRVTFNQLRTVEAVARLQSVTHAARELHLTQPTVSAQLQDLQMALETPLFEPVGRGIRPTPAADLLRETALDLFARWQRFQEDLLALQGLERGTLRIAGVTTTEYFIAQWLADYSVNHPGIDIDLAVDNRDAVVNRLMNDDIEIAVMMMPPAQLSLASVKVMHNQLVLIGAKDHPWAQQKRLPRQALNHQPLLMREHGSGTRLATEAYLREHDLKPVVRATLGSNEAIKHAVATGLGLAVVSEHVLPKKPSSEGIAVLSVTGFPLKRQWQLVWRKDRRLSLAAQTFIDEVSGRY